MRKSMGFIKRLRQAKKETQPNEKPAVVKTHLRNMIVVPEMIGSVVGIYNGKTFNQVEIKVRFSASLISFGSFDFPSPKWSATTSPSSRSPTSPSGTVAPVLVPPTRRVSFPSSKRLYCSMMKKLKIAFLWSWLGILWG